MGLFKRESLHDRLAREGGLEQSEPPPHDTTPRWAEVGIHGVPRPREWDATALVEAPDLEGERIRFVALPDGSLLVEEGAAPGVIAEALGAKLAPPYRVEAVRRDERWWAAAGRAIDVRELPDDVAGDELELIVNEGARTLRVDGVAEFGGIPALERVGEERGESYVVHARRLSDSLWEVAAAPL